MVSKIAEHWSKLKRNKDILYKTVRNGIEGFFQSLLPISSLVYQNKNYEKSYHWLIWLHHRCFYHLNNPTWSIDNILFKTFVILLESTLVRIL